MASLFHTIGRASRYMCVACLAAGLGLMPPVGGTVPAFAAGTDWLNFGGSDDNAAPKLPAAAQDDPDIKDLMAGGPLPERTLGKSGAPVTVVEYASLGCALCRGFHKATFPQLKKSYIDTGKVHFIFREFPIGKSSAAAAVAARCVPEKDFFRIAAKFMNTTGQWNGREPIPDALYKVVQETGLSRSAFDTCMANQNTIDGVVKVKQRGREFGVQGTPTFFINGRRVRGALSFDDMKKLIDEHLTSTRNPS